MKRGLAAPVLIAAVLISYTFLTKWERGRRDAPPFCVNCRRNCVSRVYSAKIYNYMPAPF